MNRRRNVVTGLMFIALIVALSIAQSFFQNMSAENRGQMVEVRRFEVDPLFPKPLPNHWYQGQTIGLGVDAQDHVWIVHRADSLSASEAALDNKTGLCCAAARPVLEFDQQGNLLHSWGGKDGPGFQWPESNHGI